MHLQRMIQKMKVIEYVVLLSYNISTLLFWKKNYQKIIFLSILYNE
jgi:hypothetical protein